MKKLVAAKKKEGYERAKTVEELELEKPPAKPPARNNALEAAIFAAPDDPEPRAVYADWLQGQGDPRGELIALQHAQAKKKDGKRTKRVNELFEKNAAELLGPLRPHVKTMDGKDEDAFTWKGGFIDSARLSFDYYSNEERGVVELHRVLEALLRHPSGMFVRTIEFGLNRRDPDQKYQPLLDVLAKEKPRALTKLVVGDFEYPDETEISWTEIGKLGKVWKAVPTLEHVEIQGGGIDLGKVEAPKLKRFFVRTGGLPKASAKALSSLATPQLEVLEIWFGADEHGGTSSLKDLAGLLTGKGLPKLKHLGLKNAEFQDGLAKAIASAPIVKQLETLDLSMGTMTDDGAKALGAAAKSLRHLASLDVSDNFLTSAGIAALKGVAKKVVTGKQREADDWGDGEMHRYVSVGE
jgi:uncharacterized protein (TIGR02996 family)